MPSLSLTELLIYTAISTLETYIFFLFFNDLLTKIERYKPFYAIPIVAYWAFQMVTYVYRFRLLSTIIPTYILATIIVLIFYEEELRYKVFTVHILIFLNYACRFFAIGVYTYLYPLETIGDKLPVLTPGTQVITCALFFVMTKLLLLIRNLRRRGIRRVYEFISCFIPLLMIFSIVFHIYMFAKDAIAPYRFFLNISALFASIAVLSFYYLDKYNIISSVKQYSETAKKLLEVEKKHLSSYLKMQEETWKFQHDFRNHIQNLFYLCSSGNSQEAARYISHLIDNPVNRSKIILTQNHAVDGMLQHYSDTMEEAGIDVNISTMIPQELPFDDVDLCIIISNLLSNAQEACERIPEDSGIKPYVNVTIHRRKNFLLIKVENSFDGKVIMQREHFLSIKRHASTVGIGLQNVQETTQKYHGLFKVTPHDTIFTAEVLLPYPEDAVSNGSEEEKEEKEAAAEIPQQQ